MGVKSLIVLGITVFLLVLIVLGFISLIKYFIRYNAKIKNSNNKENNEFKNKDL